MRHARYYAQSVSEQSITGLQCFDPKGFSPIRIRTVFLPAGTGPEAGNGAWAESWKGSARTFSRMPHCFICISWMDWSQLDANQEIFRFFKGIAFRNSQLAPSEVVLAR